jgi:cysteine-rich repeat protein
MNGDGCDNNCRITGCGNGIVTFPEQCDDGNANNGDCCSATCQSNTVCGDGMTCGSEQCDDGNVDNGDGCDSMCMTEVTGFACANSADCRLDPANNACNSGTCTAMVCTYVCSKFGDVTKPPNGIVNLDDILCVLGGFAAIANCPNADLNPCGGNGIVNLDDILSVLAAFGGANQCSCTTTGPTPMGTPPLCGSISP